MPTLPHFAGDVRILQKSRIIEYLIGNIGDMMRDDVNTLIADTIKVLATRKSNFRGWHFCNNLLNLLHSTELFFPFFPAILSVDQGHTIRFTRFFIKTIL